MAIDIPSHSGLRTLDKSTRPAHAPIAHLYWLLVTEANLQGLQGDSLDLKFWRIWAPPASGI